LLKTDFTVINLQPHLLSNFVFSYVLYTFMAPILSVYFL